MMPKRIRVESVGVGHRFRGLEMEMTHNFLLLPSSKIDVAQVLRGSGKTKEECDQTIATRYKNAFAGDRLFSEFALSGLTKISKAHANIFIDVDAVIVISQSFDHRIPSLSTRIQKHFNLKTETFCVDILDGCSGYIKALSIASMLSSNAYKKVLIISGDINSAMTTNAELATKSYLVMDLISVLKRITRIKCEVI